MTNLNRVRLPLYNAYNWGFVFAQYSRAAKLVVVAIVVGIVLHLGNGWLAEHNERLAAEQANAALAADTYRLANFGALTATDYREGTTDIKVKTLRKPTDKMVAAHW